jgi:hypothetical protein
MNEIPEIRNFLDSIDAPVQCRDLDPAVPEPRHFIFANERVKAFRGIVPENEQGGFLH